jgi:hypothetical protein
MSNKRRKDDEEEDEVSDTELRSDDIDIDFMR